MTGVPASRPRARARSGVQVAWQECGLGLLAPSASTGTVLGDLCVPAREAVPQQPSSICNAFCRGSCWLPGEGGALPPSSPLSETPPGEARPTCPCPRAADTNDHELGGFKTAAFILWPLWCRLVPLPGLWGPVSLAGVRHSRPCFGLPLAVSLGVSSPHLIRTPVLGSGPTLIQCDPPITSLCLQRRHLQMQSHPEGPGGLEFGGYSTQCIN